MLTVIAIPYVADFYFHHLIVTELNNQVIATTDSAYTLKIKHLETNLFLMSVILSDLELQPADTVSFEKPRYYLSSDKVTLSRFSLWNLLRKNNFELQQLRIENPVFKIFQGSQSKIKNTDSLQTFSLYKVIEPLFQQLSINTIVIDNADVSIINATSNKEVVFKSNRNNIYIKAFRIDKESENSGRNFQADSFMVNFQNISYQLANGLYTIEGSAIHASYTDSLLTIDNARVIPNYTKSDFDEAAGYQTDRLSISSTKIGLYGFHLKSFIEANYLIADKLTVDEMNLHVYRDKNIPRKEKPIKSIQFQIKSIPFFVAINEMNLVNSRITYEEMAEGKKQAGKIIFSHVNASLSGITNDSMPLSQNSKLYVHVTGKFMETGSVDVSYVFPMNTNETVFACRGKITGLQLPDINQMLEPNANIKIESGKVDLLSFDFNANEQHATGQLIFTYHDLSVKIQNKTKHGFAFKEDMFSFLANTFVIKKDNPSGKHDVRKGRIVYERNPNRFIFNYTWKALLSGIKPSIGLPARIK